ncbi:hypothetical protein [Streptomyces sp. NPDC017230]|uniref:hypothetical protein n=1 Tax=unclassified Streptomyces TaxID=2593676 RepID=UPI00379BA4D5
MTARANRWARPHDSVVRCAWGVVLALLAAVAVLIHHDTTVVRPAAMSSMSGMNHGFAAMTVELAMSGHGAAQLATAPTTGMGDAPACAGPAMWHCSAGDVSTVKLAPPSAAPTADRADTAYGVSTGVPTGVFHRAPPDLSVLSRLLI